MEDMEMLTIAEAARVTRKHPDTIRRLIKRSLKEDSKADSNIKQELVNGGFSYRISKEYLLKHMHAASAGGEAPMQEHRHADAHADMHTNVADRQRTQQDNSQQPTQPHTGGMHADGRTTPLQSPHADTQVLRETLDILKEQLRQKDKQIDQLLERNREMNILLKGYQDKYLLEAPKEQVTERESRTIENTPVEPEPEKTEGAKSSTSKSQKSKSKRPGERKRGLFSWFRG